MIDKAPNERHPPVKEEDMNRRIASGLLLAAFLSAGMLGRPGAAFSQRDDRNPGAIEEKQYQGVSYMSGGIGEGEREALRQLEKNYNLKIVYALAEGNYLALVDTVVKDAQGKTVLATTAQGPWLYARLEAGRYTITATTLQGQTQEKPVQVQPQGRQEVTMTWKRDQTDSR
jgi:hypothetical protein